MQQGLIDGLQAEPSVEVKHFRNLDEVGKGMGSNRRAHRAMIKFSAAWLGPGCLRFRGEGTLKFGEL